MLDLQLYVYTGMALPRTQEAFERDLPEEMFKELAQIDAELYPVSARLSYRSVDR